MKKHLNKTYTDQFLMWKILGLRYTDYNLPKAEVMSNYIGVISDDADV